MSLSAPSFDDLTSVPVDAADWIGPVDSLHQLAELASSLFQPSDLDIDLADVPLDERTSVFTASLTLTLELEDRLDLSLDPPS